MDELDRRDEEALLNLRDKSDAELRTLLDELTAEEDEVSMRRRILHGRIDILRSELVRRMQDEPTGHHDVITGSDIDRLVQILARDLRAVRNPVLEDETEDDED